MKLNGNALPFCQAHKFLFHVLYGNFHILHKENSVTESMTVHVKPQSSKIVQCLACISPVTDINCWETIHCENVMGLLGAVFYLWLIQTLFVSV